MKELFLALTKAQAKMGKASKDSTNPHFRSKYADLSSCTDAIRDVIGEFGLGYIQVCHDSDKAACVETIIVHESGEQISCGKVSVPVSKQDAQGFGSAQTYARRYSLSAACGLAPDDDDGNNATKAPPKRQEPAKPVFCYETVLAQIIAAPKADALLIAKGNKMLMTADQAAEVRGILVSKA